MGSDEFVHLKDEEQQILEKVITSRFSEVWGSQSPDIEWHPKLTNQGPVRRRKARAKLKKIISDRRRRRRKGGKIQEAQCSKDETTSITMYYTMEFIQKKTGNDSNTTLWKVRNGFEKFMLLAEGRRAIAKELESKGICVLTAMFVKRIKTYRRNSTFLEPSMIPTYSPTISLDVNSTSPTSNATLTPFTVSSTSPSIIPTYSPTVSLIFNSSTLTLIATTQSLTPTIEFKAECAKENQLANECGSNKNEARTSCCDGFVCNNNERCVTAPSTPSTLAPTYSTSPSRMPSLSHRPSKYFNNNDIDQCAQENQLAVNCGSGWAQAKIGCCDGLVCIDKKCMPSSNNYAECAPQYYFAKDCGARVGKSSCCDGLVCNNRRCIME